MPSTHLTALPTSYAGVTFRSRLEARWAVFFDQLAVPWDYEPEGFELPDGDCYLPDFWLPRAEVWYEVKGKYPSTYELKRAAQLEGVTGQRAFIAWGSLPRDAIDIGAFSDPPERGEHHGVVLTAIGGWYDAGYQWQACRCGDVRLVYGGTSNKECGHGFRERTTRALETARGWRFTR